MVVISWRYHKLQSFIPVQMLFHCTDYVVVSFVVFVCLFVCFIITTGLYKCMEFHTLYKGSHVQDLVITLYQ